MTRPAYTCADNAAEQQRPDEFLPAVPRELPRRGHRVVEAGAEVDEVGDGLSPVRGARHLILRAPRRPERGAVGDHDAFAV